MKKYLAIICLLLLAVAVPTKAQQGRQDVIYLKESSILRGIIVERIPDSICKIEIAGGSIIAVKFSQIERLEQVNRPEVYIIYSRSLRRRIRSIGLESCLSYLYYADGGPSTGQHSAESGMGIYLLPEFRVGDHVSALVGAALQYIPTRNTSNSFSGDDIYIDRGYQFRIELPVWLRVSFGKKLGYFFQFGLGVGANLYQGKGYYFSGGYLSAMSYNGYEKINTGFVSVGNFGAGLRAKVKQGLDLIAYLQLSPIDIEFFFEQQEFNPYLQLHFGFNFNCKRKEQDEE